MKEYILAVVIAIGVVAIVCLLDLAIELFSKMWRNR